MFLYLSVLEFKGIFTTKNDYLVVSNEEGETTFHIICLGCNLTRRHFKSLFP
jgi:hypothetical protein